MAKSKGRSEVEHFKGIIRNLKSEIRHLRKELGRLNKLHLDEQERLTEALEEVVEELQASAPLRCPECNSSDFKRVEIGNRAIESCNNCDYRRGKKIDGQ